MLIAVGHFDGFKRRLVVGLVEENMVRLRNDEPILRDLGAEIPELEGWELVVLGPEDTVRFMARVGPTMREGGGQ